jgi:periplasmic divalent cation tolerance protein
MAAEIVVYCTASSQEEARKLADALVGERLSACVSIVSQVNSTYRWKGKVEKADEALLIIKTRKIKFAALAKRIKQLHSYTVPEILALPVAAGNPDYLKWLRESTK